MQRLQTISWQKLLRRTGLLLAALLLVSLSLTAGGWSSLIEGNFSSSKIMFQLASPVSFVVSRATFGQVGILEAWYQAVWLGQWLSEFQLQTTDDPATKVGLLSEEMTEVAPHFERLVDGVRRSWLLSLMPGYENVVTQLTAAEQFAITAEGLLASNDQFLLLLQNSDELRATGGFIGSYAVLDFTKANPFELAIRDIYDPSGVSIVLSSPAGHARYLSGGEGLRLHDANWSPDFPTAAQLILRYFANIAGDPQTYDGVIAVPLSAIEALVEAVDGLYLPDQDRTITAAEFAELLRQDRAEFFPGSQQKQQSLQQAYTALWLRFSQLSMAEWQSVLKRLDTQRVVGDVQLYAKEPALQRQLEQLGLAGMTQTYDPSQIFVFPVESNVGINKANRKVARSLSLAIDAQNLLTVTTQFANHYTVAERPVVPAGNVFYTAADHLGYANYYRLLVRSDMRVRRVIIGGQPLDSWDEEIVVSDSGVSYLQVGFLVTVPEEEQRTVQVQFALPSTAEEQFVIQKQIGLQYDEVIVACTNGLSISPVLEHNLYQADCLQEVE